MKYSIFINQKNITELAPKLDIVDAAILDFLIHFCSSDDKKIKQMTFQEEGISYRYTWINYGYLIEQMPLLGIRQKTSITNRLQKISDEGFIKTFYAKDQNVYIRLTEKIKSLYFEESEPSIKTDRPSVKTDSYHQFKLIDNNNNINQLDTLNKNIPSPSKEIQEIYSFFKEKVHFGSRLTDDAKLKIKNRLKNGFTIDELKKAIDNFSQDSWNMQRNSGRGVAWFFHSDNRTDQFINMKPKKGSRTIIATGKGIIIQNG